MEIESQPTELDQIERKILQLSIEKQSLSKEEDAASKERLIKLEKELSELTAKRDAMKMQWQNEKNSIDKSRKLKEQLEEARFNEEKFTREGNLEKAAELKYSVIPSLEKQLSESAAHDKQIEENPERESLLRQEVTEEDIARVVSTWTGIPVAKMLSSEKQKYLQLEEVLHKRVIGQNEAIRRLDVRELLAARACDIDDGVRDGLADLGGLIGGRREFFRGSGEVFRRLRNILHELADFLVHFLHGKRHHADFVGARAECLELGRILFADREVARADDFHALRDFLDRTGDARTEVARECDEDELQDDHDSETLQDVGMELVIDFLLARGDDLVDFINIDARADDPLVWLEADGIAEFRQ